MRLLSGVLAGQAFDSVLVGDPSLSRRPMRRITTPLGAMGARIETADGGTPPLRVRGGRPLHGIDYASPIASAQVKSAVLLAGLYAAGETRVTEPRPTRDYTERMLAACGWPIEFSPGRARLHGGHALHAIDIDVPADFSSAAFFIAAACVVPGSELVLRNVGVNPRRTGLLRVLRAMGADIREAHARTAGGEPVADLRVRHSALTGIEVDPAIVPSMVDEFPVLFVAAALAEGRTVTSGLEELRVKESDRIAVMAAALAGAGAQVEETEDGLVIDGSAGEPLRGSGSGSAKTHLDHRIAMSMAVAGLASREGVEVDDTAPIATSFPQFEALLDKVTAA
jgi:3-phosphoshikimate 1-carboxyvinyltransferase